MPFGKYQGEIHVSVKMFYQALPPKWMAPMFDESTPEIEVFREMYMNADLSPVLMNSQFLDNIFVSPVSNEEVEQARFKVFPNPTYNGQLFIQQEGASNVNTVKIYDQSGKLLQVIKDRSINELELPSQKGLYILEFISEKDIFRKKVISL